MVYVNIIEPYEEVILPSFGAGKTEAQEGGVIQPESHNREELAQDLMQSAWLCSLGLC